MRERKATVVVTEVQCIYNPGNLDEAIQLRREQQPRRSQRRGGLMSQRPLDWRHRIEAEKTRRESDLRDPALKRLKRPWLKHKGRTTGAIDILTKVLGVAVLLGLLAVPVAFLLWIY